MFLFYKSAWLINLFLIIAYYIYCTNYLEVQFMNFFVNCLKGIALGAGAILPGISSGVLCVIFRIL